MDVIRGGSGTLYEAASFGYGEGGAQNFSGEAHAASARVQRLARSESYFRNRQHDDKLYSWDGCLLPAFEPGHQPYLSTAKLPEFVPLGQRRPCAPYRLARFIVRAFTALLFGEGRFPEIRVVGDPETQDFLRALSTLARLPEHFEHARDVGGSSGTVALSWRFWEGTPRIQVHPGSTVHVQEWADREELVVGVATHVVQVEREVYDDKEGKIVNKRFWIRRDWTTKADVAFVEQPVDARDKEWIVDEANTIVHDEGRAHVVWVPNARDYDGTSVDGEADYTGLGESCDGLDVLFSALMYGGAKNIEPTLTLAIDDAVLAKIERIYKGSDNALPVGKGGSADYLEISGASIDAGVKLVGLARGAILETAQVVAPDPDKVAAAGSSSVALKMLYAPMLTPAAGLRGRYGRAIVRLLDDMRRSIELHSPVEEEDGTRVYSFAPRNLDTPNNVVRAELPEGEGEEVAVEVVDVEPPEEELFVAVPPRVEEEAVKDPVSGQPTGETRVRVVPRALGKGGAVELHWPDWFPPTAEDRSKETSTLSTAAGGRPVLSHKSAVEKAAAMNGLDPDEEWREVSAQVVAEQAAQAGMYPPAGELPTKPGEPSSEGTDAEQAAAATGQEVDVLPETVLNGAQVTAALEIVLKVTTGELPRDAALGQLEVLFNLQPGQALKILGSVGLDDSPKPGAPAPP